MMRWVDIDILNRAIKDNTSVEVEIDWRLELSEIAGQKKLSGREKNKHKGPQVGICLAYLRNREKASCGWN